MSLPRPITRPDRQVASSDVTSARTGPLSPGPRPAVRPIVDTDPVIDHERALRHHLTDRELEVLTGMSRGLSNSAIGRELFICEDTVKTHARRLFRKLSVQARGHAVHRAWELGILTKAAR